MFDYRAIVESNPRKMRKWIVPKLIGVVGNQEHGKDTIAHLLHARFNFMPIAFARHLRQICMLLLDIPAQMMNTRDGKAQKVIGVKTNWVFPWRSGAEFNLHVMQVLEYAYHTAPGDFRQSMTRVYAGDEPKVGAAKLPIKEVADAILVQMLKHIYMPLMNGYVFTPREVLQLVGTEVFRAVDPTIWIWAWERECAKHRMVVAPDTRFVNEAEHVKQMGGQLWRVVRPDYSSDTQVGMDHASETKMDFAVDTTLINSADVSDLWNVIVGVLDVYARERKIDVDSGFAYTLNC